MSPFSATHCWILPHARLDSAIAGSTIPLPALEIPAIYTKDPCKALEIMLTSLTVFVVSDTPYVCEFTLIFSFKRIGRWWGPLLVPYLQQGRSFPWWYLCHTKWGLVRMLMVWPNWVILGVSYGRQSHDSGQKMLYGTSLSDLCEVGTLLMPQAACEEEGTIWAEWCCRVLFSRDMFMGEEISNIVHNLFLLSMPQCFQTHCQGSEDINES